MDEFRCDECDKTFKDRNGLDGHNRFKHHVERAPAETVAPPVTRVTKRQGKKTIPGWSQGVRENASIRMVKMLQPICPFSQKTYDTTPEGRQIERRSAGVQPSCQTQGGQWWVACEERGHNPYYRKRVWYSKQDIYSTDPETGEQVKTDDRTVRHEDEIPNVAQVAAHVRVNSGKGPQFKHDRHGFRYLPEMGFDEVCQLRNCQKPVTHTSIYGEYCSRNHAALAAADGIGTRVTQIPGRFDQGAETEVRIKRQEQLRQAAQAAQVRAIS